MEELWELLTRESSFSDFAPRACLIASLAAATYWALAVAFRDTRWVYEVDKDYARYSIRLKQISKPDTAQEKLEELSAYEADRIDAARARQARLAFLGLVFPSVVLLILIGWHSWLAYGGCALTGATCEPSLRDALTLAGWNLASAAYLDEILAWSKFWTPTVPQIRDSAFLELSAFFARNYAFGHFVAIAFFEFKIGQFKLQNQQSRLTLQEIANRTSATVAVPQPIAHPGMATAQSTLQEAA
jgi:hypothetical protein